MDKPRTRQRNHKGATCQTILSSALTEKLRRYIKEQNISLFVTLLATYKILLYRYTGQHDLCVGVPAAGRPEQEFAEAIGYFINMLVMRSQIDGNQPVSAFMEQLKWVVAEALGHANYPFAKLVRTLEMSRDASHSPVFQAGLTLQSFS